MNAVRRSDCYETLQHLIAHYAPIVVGCPACNSPLDIQENVEKLNPSTREVSIAPRVAFCCGCEFVHEF